MNQQTYRALEANGWSPDRRADVSADLAAIRSAGYDIWPDLVEFLESFSGITVTVQIGGQEDRFWINPPKALELCQRSWIDKYISRAGQQLVPVGYGASEHMLLLVGQDGKSYGSYDNVLGVLGASTSEMLENLVAGDDFTQQI